MATSRPCWPLPPARRQRTRLANPHRPREELPITYESDDVKNIIYTVGHSTRTIESFVKLIKAHEIEAVVDVRRIAKSRHNPQYNEGELSKSLGNNGISYIRIEGLGGLRHTTKISVNAAWENLSFRGYADYMQTPEFTKSIQQLIEIATGKRTAIMCAESVPWRCHRSLIGDALEIRNIPVEHIMSEKGSRSHIVTSFAHVVGDTITYPAKAR
jgi:uncharacterized protein (DUF488 family)